MSLLDRFRMDDKVVVIGSGFGGLFGTKALRRSDVDVTVMLTGPQAVPPRRVSQFPVVKGKIAKVSGHLGRRQLAPGRLAGLPRLSHRRSS